MSSLKTLIDLFVATPTIANAKKVISKDTHHPMAACCLSAEDGVHLANARKVVADAKDPAKLKSAMQTELRARFKNLNIEVI